LKATRKIILLLLVCSVVSACKINYSFSGASIPLEAKTVSVKYFENVASLAPPSLSQSFSEALRDKISSQTRLTLVNSNGDLNFEGKIINYIATPQAIQSGSDQAALNRLSISVTVKYTCAFDEKKNFEDTFTRFYDYPSTEPLTQAESKYIPEINSQLVQDIFNRAFINW
jgi:hypothetical protein